MSIKEDSFSQCLYFSSNVLSRRLTKMAEDAFSPLGMTPSYAFLLLAVIDQPEIQPSNISDQLELTPSTVTRLIEKLEQRELLQRTSQGRTTHVSPTEKGIKMRSEIESCWEQLKENYRSLLGDRYTEVLTEMTYKALDKL